MAAAHDEQPAVVVEHHRTHAPHAHAPRLVPPTLSASRPAGGVGGAGDRRAAVTSGRAASDGTRSTADAAPGQDVLPLDGVAPRLFTGTPTRLATWLDCPRRYRLTYVDRAPKGPPWAHGSLGLSVHNALRDWFLLPVERRTTDAAADAVRRDWVDLGFRDAAQSQEWRERAAGMVAAYVAGLDPADEPIGVERTVAFRTATMALSGRADRIDVRPVGAGADGGTEDARAETRELVVVDYKTGRHLLSAQDARTSLALAVYAVAAERTLRRRCRRVELHHLPSGQVLVWEHDDDSLRRHLERAASIAHDAGAAEQQARVRRAGADGDSAEIGDLFPARPGPLCGYCDVVRSCQEGMTAIDGVMRVPWDVLDRWSADELASVPTEP